MAELVWKQAREAARKVLDGNWDQQLPVKIERICRACGVTTYKCVMPDDLSGMIVKRAAERDAKAFIDKEEPGVRQRFTLAHELGHFIERTVIAKDDEYGFEEVRMGGRREKDYFPHEFFADEFAGAILMPEAKVKEFQSDGKKVEEMAQLFDVSVSAMRMRLDNLQRVANTK